MGDSVWVVGFCKGTEIYNKFARVNAKDAEHQKRSYEYDGMDAVIMSDDEFERFARKEQEILDKRNAEE